MPQLRVVQAYLQSSMERKCQNLQFTAELNVPKKSEDSSRRPSRCLIIPNTPVQCSSSGGDIGSGIRLSKLNDEAYGYSDDNFEEAEEEATAKSEVQSDESHIFDLNITPKRQKMSSALQEELSKYQQELKDYTNTTKDLEEKYLKINYELSEMQQKHDHFVSKRNATSADSESYSEPSSVGSEFSLQRKYTQVFHRGSSFMQVVPPRNADSLANEGQANANIDKHKSSSRQKNNKIFENRNRSRRFSSDSKENEPPPASYHKSQDKNLRNIYKVLKSVIDVGATQNTPTNRHDVNVLQCTITDLQTEQDRFRTIIEQQQHSLQDYHTRCLKAQHIMKTQQMEIQKLHTNNRQLETEINDGIDQMRHKIETKLREVAQLPQLMREEQMKSERVLKENNLLSERIRTIQAEANALKIKMEEIGRRKTTTLNRLKASERDLKIFKNYNAALKHEKRKLNEELQKMREQLNSAQNCSKRTMNRQREQSEKQRRELQKRVFELEMKLNRSQNSTTSLLQERDSLITELQTQLNTLVHNFEVSQKHIRVLRRHIYSMSGGNAQDAVARNRVLDETA